MIRINAKENFIQLVNTYQNLVFSVCVKLTGDYFIAEDLAQDTFLAAYEHMDRFDGKNAKAWLCRIASNKCIDYLRSAKRLEVSVSEEELPETVDDESKEPFRQFMSEEVMNELATCINALSPPYDEIARLHFIKNMTAKEIAKKYDMKEKTVRTQIYRARDMLRKSYRKELLEE